VPVLQHPSLTLLPLAVALWLGNPIASLFLGIGWALGAAESADGLPRWLASYSLQTAIVLLGFKFDLSVIWQSGQAYSGMVSGYVLGIGAVGLVLGAVIGVATKQRLLLASGTAICGGTTIATLSPIISASSRDTATALSMVFLLNAVAMVVYPWIGQALELDQQQFGLWAALSIHDTSSVMATASAFGEQALDTATVIKLGRTLWLVPLAIIMSLYAHRGSGGFHFPTFILLFVGASALRSTLPLPAWLVGGTAQLSALCLVTALFFIGCQIDRATLLALQWRSVIMAVVLWLIAAGGTLALIIA